MRLKKPIRVTKSRYERSKKAAWKVEKSGVEKPAEVVPGAERLMELVPEARRPVSWFLSASWAICWLVFVLATSTTRFWHSYSLFINLFFFLRSSISFLLSSSKVITSSILALLLQSKPVYSPWSLFSKSYLTLRVTSFKILVGLMYMWITRKIRVAIIVVFFTLFCSRSFSKLLVV